MTTSSKGTQNEKACLEAYKAYMLQKKDYILIDEWRTVRTGFKTKKGFISHNNDFLHDFDLGVAYSYKGVGVLVFIQVKSKFELKYYRYLQERWSSSPAHCYLASYSKLPKSIKANEAHAIESERIRLDDKFTMVRI